jgi:uncharacterized ParB-like nuclease family protein
VRLVLAALAMAIVLLCEGQVGEVPLAQLSVDADWNSRSASSYLDHAEVSDTDDESSGLEGLASGIRAIGQTTPVDVRLTGDAELPYALVTGFRRTAALRAIYASPEAAEARAAARTPVPGLSDGCVRATCRGKIAEAEAFILNASENLSRDNLSPVDVLGVVERGMRRHGMSRGDLALVLNKSVAAVQAYERVAAMQPEILQHWRNGGAFDGVQSPRRVGFAEMVAISRLSAAEQPTAYRHELLRKARVADVGAIMDRMRGRAEAAGRLLARMERAKLTTVSARWYNDWMPVIGEVVRVGARTMSYPDSVALSKIAHAAYERERDAGGAS